MGALGPLLVAIAPLVGNLIEGEALHAALAAVTATQWATIAVDAVNFADPSLLTALSQLHPLVASFLQQVLAGKAPSPLADVLAAFFNGPKPATIPAYDANGQLTQIPNPDLKQGE